MRRQSHLYLRFSTRVDRATNARIHAIVRGLLDAQITGLVDVIPGYNTLLVEFDSRVISGNRIRALAKRFDETANGLDRGRRLALDVVYEGPDLADVAASAGLSVDEVVRRHSAPEYMVYAVGFTPGYPFLGDVDPTIRMPRLEAPRALVPAGSVAIADGQTGIYPLASPGGWRILGRTTERVYDPHRASPFLLEPGDRVRFVPVRAGVELSPPSPLILLPKSPSVPTFLVQRPGLLDLVLDSGRRLGGRFGLARSGPLDATSARIATGLVGNRRDDPLLEINVFGPILETLRDTVVAVTGVGVVPHVDGTPVRPYRSFLVKRGQVLTFPPGPVGRRGYLAIAGGIASDRFFGSASVDARGLIGRALTAGDVVGVAGLRTPRVGFSFAPYCRNAQMLPLRLLPGPQYDAGLVTAMCEGPLRIERSDRMGVRLSCVQAQGGGVTSEGNPLGAVQLTSDGHPIILLNDRGTMGGYTKPAIVDPRDLSRLAQARDGEWVVFLAPRQRGSIVRALSDSQLT